jgi:DNA mismatch repair protein MutS
MVNSLYEIYKKAYQHHAVKYGADTAIFYQVGKFYEMYDWIDPTSGNSQTSMRKAVEVLGIQLSPKEGDGPGGTEGLFAGVPEQSLHKYATLLTRQNWTVVIYDQVKDSKGAVTSRTVSRILSPGTHVESAQQEAVYISGIWLEEALWASSRTHNPPSFALMALDLTTGKSVTYEDTAVGKRDSWTADGAFHFFQVHCPRECIVWWRGDSVTVPSEEFIRRQFGLATARIQFAEGAQRAQGSLEIPLVREEFLKRSISIRSLLPIRVALQIQETSRTERLICSLLQRIEEMYPSGARHLAQPERWNPSTNLFLGNQALLQLNMITPSAENSILGLFQRTYTTFGLRAIRQRILYPLADPVILEKSYNEIEFLLDSSETRESLTTNLRKIADLPRLHRRLSSGTTTPSEILLLDQSYTCVERLNTLFKNSVLAQGDGWSVAKIQSSLHEVFSIEKARQASADLFCFQNSVAPEITAIEERIADLKKKMTDTLSKIAEWAGIPLENIRLEERELTAPSITGPKGIMTTIGNLLKGTKGMPFPGMHMNQKKTTQLEVPALETIFQSILRSRSELQDKVRAVLPHLCDRISKDSFTSWDAMEDWVARLDVTATIARVSSELAFVRPVLKDSSESSLNIEGLRHPLIEASLNRSEYVKHSVELDEDCRGWLIYGMNASGKSSLMKAVGITVILAQAGCYVPCKSFSFVPFKSLFTRILNTDNLWAGLSSFAVEMTELREILDKADKNSLVLGDELCSGTESVSATAIVGAGLQWLHAKSAKFIFATHLHGLINIPSVMELPCMKTWHLKVRYDHVADRLIYERTLTPGPGSSLYGLEVARAMNLPEEVLQIAQTIRRTLLGTANDSEAQKSHWNSGIVLRKCEICSTEIVKDLEVHHIRHRKDTVDGLKVQDHVRNLIVVCTVCHDKHHAGLLEIGPLVQTSEGQVRLSEEVSEPTAKKKKESVTRSKWSEEQILCIKEYLRMYPNSPPKRAVFDLQEKGITISAASLGKFR